MQEEAGLTGEATAIGWLYPDNRRRKERLHILLVTDLKKAPAKKDPEEEFETYWFTADQIDQLIAEGEIVTHSMLSAWAIYRSEWYTKTHRNN